MVENFRLFFELLREHVGSPYLIPLSIDYYIPIVRH